MRKLTLVVVIGCLLNVPQVNSGIAHAREAEQVTVVPMPVYILMSPLEARSRAFRYRPDSILFGPPTNGPWLTEATLSPNDNVTVRTSNRKPISGAFLGLADDDHLAVMEATHTGLTHAIAFDSIRSIHVGQSPEILDGVMVGLFGGASFGMFAAAMSDFRDQRFLFLGSLTTGTVLGALIAALRGVDNHYYFAPDRRRLSIVPVQ